MSNCLKLAMVADTGFTLGLLSVRAGARASCMAGSVRVAHTVSKSLAGFSGSVRVSSTMATRVADRPSVFDLFPARDRFEPSSQQRTFPTLDCPGILPDRQMPLYNFAIAPLQPLQAVEKPKTNPLDRYVKVVKYDSQMKAALQKIAAIALPPAENGRQVKVLKYAYDPLKKELTCFRLQPGQRGRYEPASPETDPYAAYLLGLISQVTISSTEPTLIKFGHLNRKPLVNKQGDSEIRREEKFHQDAVPPVDSGRPKPSMVVAYVGGECLPTDVRWGEMGNPISLTSTHDCAVFFPQEVDHDGKKMQVYHRGYTPEKSREVFGISFEPMYE